MDRFEANPALAADRLLVDTHIAVYEDKSFSAQDAYRLRQLLQTLPQSDLIGQALACNHLSTIALHLGDFDRAQDYAEQAARLFRNGDAEFGSLHLHTHLGQIKLMRGDLEGAEDQYREMEEALSRLPGNPHWLIAAGRVLRAEVAYEMDDLDRSSRLMDRALDSVEEREGWIDILASAYRVQTRLAYAEAGLPGALTALTHAERIARERGMPRLLHLVQLERVRALTLSDEPEAALKVLHDIGVNPDRLSLDDGDDWALRQGATIVALARWLVRTRRAQKALDLIGSAEDFAIRGGQLLSLAKLRVISAAAHWRLRAPTAATGNLLSAIRLLGRQPFRRFILDEGPDAQAIVQAALDGDHVAVQPSPEQRRRLSELAHFWAIRGAEGRAGSRARRRKPAATVSRTSGARAFEQGDRPHHGRDGGYGEVPPEEDLSRSARGESHARRAAGERPRAPEELTTRMGSRRAARLSCILFPSNRRRKPHVSSHHERSRHHADHHERFPR